VAFVRFCMLNTLLGFFLVGSSQAWPKLGPIDQEATGRKLVKIEDPEPKQPQLVIVSSLVEGESVLVFEIRGDLDESVQATYYDVFRTLDFKPLVGRGVWISRAKDAASGGKRLEFYQLDEGFPVDPATSSDHLIGLDRPDSRGSVIFSFSPETKHRFPYGEQTFRGVLQHRASNEPTGPCTAFYRDLPE